MPNYHTARWDDGVQARFWGKVHKVDNGCWEWKGTRTPKGYGQFSVDNQHYAAHRLLFIKTGNALPESLCCDHLCRNRACVNPAHIEAVTNAENVRRGEAGVLNSIKGGSITHCCRGHEYTPENTRYHRRGTRNCLQCERQNSAALTERRRVQRARAAQHDHEVG